MYVCGPTVYNYFHIGNARPFLFFDVVRRYFEYSGFEVSFAQNITDIDDKLIEQSIKEKIPVKTIAAKYIKAFFEDLETLEIGKVDHQPRATEFVGEMITLIRDLENNGFAYEANGDVYFSVNDFKDYGKLSGKKIDDLKVGARVEANDQKKNPADFTLWKKAKEGEPKWHSPWGEGRPGWHTECVVMSRKYLGDTFDIHGGGIDLIFPHHENEIAQAEATGGKKFVNYWVHNGYLNIEGEKMSKSLNNFFTARDILKKYKPEAIRFFFLSKHYRSSIDFNEEIVKESSKAVDGFYQALDQVEYLNFIDENIEYEDQQNDYITQFKEAMDDDFNTAKAIALLFEIVKKIKNPSGELASKKRFAKLLVELGSVLGFFHHLETKLQNNVSSIAEDLINLLIKYRLQFRKDKNWKMSDQIRDDLKKLGINLKDKVDGTDWEIERN